MPDPNKLKKKIESFIHLNEDSWQIIKPYFKPKEFKKGDLLVEGGQVCRYIAFNTQGIFREYFNHRGVDKTLDFIFQDSFFSSFTSFIHQTSSDINIEALTNSHTLLLDCKSDNKLFKLIPQWEELSRKITEEQFIAKEKRVNVLVSLSAKEKYADLLKNGKPDIMRNIPLRHIASYLGITPETLSRIRNKA